MGLGFGLLSGQIAPHDDRTWSDVYRELLDIAVRAEDKGFDSVWTTEHHFVDDGYMPSLLVTSAAIAARTSKIKIGTGVLLAPLHQPLRLAEDAATVQLISDGRLILGLGLGWSQIEFDAFGGSMAQRGKAMTEVLQILTQAWAGKPFRWEGDVFTFPEVGVRPTPGSHPPIVIGGTADAAVRRAARYADGFYSNASPQRFVEQVRLATAELERTGRDPADFRWMFHTVIWPAQDAASGWSEARPHIWHQRWKYSDMGPSARRGGQLGSTPDLTPEVEAQLQKRSVVGSAAQIVEYLHGVRDQVGVDVHFVARSHFSTLPYGQQAELVDRLAEGVLPHL